MRHALIYHGGFERNFPGLQSGADGFVGSDGKEHPLPEAPANVDGLRIYYMEKPGKRFAAVRVRDDEDDVILRHEVLIDPGRHLGHGQRFSPEPTMVDDAPAAALLAEIFAKNPEQFHELGKLRQRLRRLG